jgi:hypothetical protein
MNHVPGNKKLSRRAFVAALGAGGVGLATSSAMGRELLADDKSIVMENGLVRLAFSGTTGFLVEIVNKLSKESITVKGDSFEIVAEEFVLTPMTLQLKSVQSRSAELVEATYGSGEHRVIVTYRMGNQGHFCEKQLTINSTSPYKLKSLVVSRLRFTGRELRCVRYKYQENVVYFARSFKGGLFVGLELPFDTSSLASDGTMTLGYKPSLKVESNEVLESEPVFIGIYKRSTVDVEKPNLPLASESDAMVGMTSLIMGPPRHGLVSLACGWWCEMEHETYRTEAQVEADMRSIDFLAECGIDGFTDNHPWSGETEMMNRLGQNDHYAPGPLVRKLLEYARDKKVGVIFWPTMTNTHPWWPDKGRPFRADRPDWVMFPDGETVSFKFATGIPITEHATGNCVANQPFWQWLMGLQRDGMRTGYFDGWVMDGDFFGGGGVVVPVNCPSGQHDHLPGDSNYACERALKRMMATIRQENPKTFMGPMCRPAQDLGLWSNRYADAVFTLDEMATAEPLPGLSNLPMNVMYGDKIRKWSRERVHYSFFPHYMDQPQVFVAPKTMKGPDWPSEKIDYVMLSTLSCSPTMLFYLPTKAGIPAEDKAEIRKWLEWGRTRIRYLQVRKDLPQWPQAGKVDGSSHIVDDEGLVFLFNPNHEVNQGRFALSEEAIGLKHGAHFEVSQVYPEAEKKQTLNFGDDVVWDVPSKSALVLRVLPVAG